MTRRYDNRGRYQVNIETVQGNVLLADQRQPRSRSLSILLKAVREEVESRLAQSLHQYVLINLGKQVQPEQVKRPWDAEIKIGSKPSEPIAPDTPVLSVFERPDVAGKLLILGEPGSGKTTTLLDLAQGLLDRAEADPEAPVPVLFSLSSWQDPKQKIADWLVTELKQKYGVREKLGREWLAEHHLLPLLDGLDEVRPECQPACIQALNAWFQSETRPPSVVVCCRREEYANSARQLGLNGAICLQALTDGQIATYLQDVNHLKLLPLLQADTALLELVRTPLLLSITLLSYGELAVGEWQQAKSTEARVQLLLAAYVQRMMTRPLESRAYYKGKPPSTIETQHWLVYLAQQLQWNSDMEFLIEKMQPSQLKCREKWIYRRITALTGVLIFALIFALIFDLSAGLFIGPIIGFVVSLLIAIGHIDPVESIRFPGFNKVRKQINRALQISFVCCFVFLFVGLIIIFSSNASNAFIISVIQLIRAVIVIGFFGIIFGIFWEGSVDGAISGIIDVSKVDIEKRIYPNQGIWNSFHNSILFSIIGFLLMRIIDYLFYWLQFLFAKTVREMSISFAIRHMTILLLPAIIYLFFVLLFMLLVGFLFRALLACIQHLSLRLALVSFGAIPWNYARFLNYATERLFLQRIGGRYRFMHKLLQDYFAQLSTNL